MTDPDVLSRKAEHLIHELQNWHVGEHNAATAGYLVGVLGLSNDRDLRDVVRYARLNLREPILSTYSGHYSWPTGWDDDAAAHCIAQIREVAADRFAVADAIADGMLRRFPREPVQLELVTWA